MVRARYTAASPATSKISFNILSAALFSAEFFALRSIRESLSLSA